MVDALSDLYRTLSRMGRQANQGEIGVVIDGKYYGITEYAANGQIDNRMTLAYLCKSRKRWRCHCPSPITDGGFKSLSLLIPWQLVGMLVPRKGENSTANKHSSDRANGVAKVRRD